MLKRCCEGCVDSVCKDKSKKCVDRYVWGVLKGCVDRVC